MPIIFSGDGAGWPKTPEPKIRAAPKTRGRRERMVVENSDQVMFFAADTAAFPRSKFSQ
jgi:hypothetical protein